MKRRADVWVAAACLAAAVFFVFIWRRTSEGGNNRAFDIYQYWYPNMLYALRALHDGGRGLLWNPWQSCGQPYFGISSTGAPYPANLSFLVLSPDHALMAVSIFNLVVAGISTYLLARELGVGVVGALSGALSLELANGTVDAVTWTPMMSGPFVWLPAAFLFCERLLRAPTLRSALGLAVVLSIALLPGAPQHVFYGYQLILLRVAWELATRRVAQPARTVGLVTLGLALPALLTAFELVPAIELARLSARGGSLSIEEVGGGTFLTWPNLRRSSLLFRFEMFNPFLLVPTMLAAASAFRPATRRHAVFYALAAGLTFAFAFGPSTPVFRIYSRLPLGQLFREPQRVLWITGICMSLLTAFGVDALVALGETRRRRLAAAVAATLAALGLHFVYTGGHRPRDWALAGFVVGAMLLAVVRPSRRPWAGAGLAAAVAVNLLAFPVSPAGRPIASWVLRPAPMRTLIPAATLFQHAPLFTALRGMMTPQDRIYPVVDLVDFTFMHKTAALFGVRSMYDYEAQPLRRYAEFAVMLRLGREMRGINDWYYPNGWTPPGFSRRLLDLTAARYVVAVPKADRTADVMRPPLRLVSETDGLLVYENSEALPRARYVPRVAVVADDHQLLRRLVFGRDDLRRVAFLETAPPSGFTGIAGDITGGTVDFVTDDPEHVVLRVHAPDRGFLFLADQHYPGWNASVNGVRAPIMRADYAFRLVEVPAGGSTVEFRYAPVSVRIGAGISALTVLALMVLALRRRGRERLAGSPHNVLMR